MSRLATSFVLGYHGCEEAVGLQALRGETSLIQSDKAYDWLGPSAYFWEADPRRALEWAEAKFGKNQAAKPFVIGAVIDLRHCLDLTNREDLDILRAAYEAFVATQKVSGLPLPKDKNHKGDSNSDQLLRFLDCAVINHLHSMVDASCDEDPDLEPYDTVRGISRKAANSIQGPASSRRATRRSPCETHVAFVAFSSRFPSRPDSGLSPQA